MISRLADVMISRLADVMISRLDECAKEMINKLRRSYISVEINAQQSEAPKVMRIKIK